MSQVITNAFEKYWQSCLTTEQPVVLDEFILADIPNLDITSPIDPETGLPPQSQIVHRQTVDQRGRINNNAVAYTIVMDTTVGDFSFNAMYLRNKQNGVIGMIVYKGRETKLKTDQTTGQTGNSLVKSMLMGYDQAAEATLTNVDAGTWQIDYAARLRGQDEDLRQLTSQLYGHHTFIGDGFKVVQQDGGHQVTQGVAIVGGLRVELKAPEVIHPGSKPIGVWVDVHRAGSLLSEHQNHFTIITSVADLTDHVDSNGYQHYVAKLGTILADSTIEDGRSSSSGAAGSIPDTFALWKRSMAEAGHDLIGSFGSTLTIENENQLLLSRDGKDVYAWTGGLPKDVMTTASENDEGWQSKKDAILKDLLQSAGGAKHVMTNGGLNVQEKLDSMEGKLASASDFCTGFPSHIPQLGARDHIGVYVEVENADAGGSMWIFRRSGSAFVAEQLLTGAWSAGESLPASCPVWRFGRVQFCEGLVSYKHSYSNTNVGGAVPEVTFTSTLFDGGGNVFKNGVRMWRFQGAGAFMEFQTSESEISLLLGSNEQNSASLKIQLFLDGAYVKDLDVVKCSFGSEYDAFIWSAKNPYAGRKVTVRISATNGENEYVMVGGIDAAINELKYDSADHIAFHINNDPDKVISGATGAQNYAVQELSTGLFGGESHGGEYVSRRNVYFDSKLQVLKSGTFFVCSRVSVEQRSQVVWKDVDPVITMEVKSQIMMTSEGSQFVGDFIPKNVVATTAYFSMFTYQGTFNRVYIPRYVDTSQLTEPVQIQMPQASGFKAVNSVGAMVECSWSLIFKNNAKYKPYLQRKPQGNLYDKFYYGLAIPPDNGVKLSPLSFVSVRKYST